MMIYDAVVIGAGTAGLVAAARLTEEGATVAVVAKGAGCTHLAGGTVDVLGYAPARVEQPGNELQGFVQSNPAHPYARLGRAHIEAALSWFKHRVRIYEYVGSLEDNFVLPTAAGAPKPAALAPETMSAGDLRRGGRFTIVGFTQLKDFYPAYLADNLARSRLASENGVTARAVSHTAPVAQADVTPVAFARRFEDAEFRKRVVAGIERDVDGSDVVGFPAVLGLGQARTVWQEFQDGLGAPVFEIPTLPPSVPGMRLFAALKKSIVVAGGRIVMGGAVVGGETDDGSIVSVAASAAARPVVYRARNFVLATGGFASGGITMDSKGAVTEAIFDLPVAGVPSTEKRRFSPDYWGSHPIARAGLSVDDDLRPLGGDGGAAYSNLRAAGAALAGAEPWREKSGEGISIATGHRAATSILEQET